MNLILVILALYLHTTLSSEYKPDSGAFQYQNSFNGPFGSTHIPFWEIGGSAMIKEQYIQLTSNQKSQVGWIWSNRVLRARDWEILLTFSIGSLSRSGGNGIAFWYTKDRLQTGTLMGNTDTWNGLGIFIDTYDNDGARDNPQIYAIYNDGSKKIDPNLDGKQHSLGLCSAKSIRQMVPNPEANFYKLLIRLNTKNLYIAYDATPEGAESNWVTCLSGTVPIEDTVSGYYLGVTADTSGSGDFHAVKSLSTWSVRSKVITKDEVKEPLPPNTQVKNPSEITEKKTIESAYDATVEILTKLAELERMDNILTESLDGRFLEMYKKLEVIESQRSGTLNTIINQMDSINKEVNEVDFADLKQDVKEAVDKLLSLKSRIEEIESLIRGTDQKAFNLHGLHNSRSSELEDLAERSGWGLWTYLLFFQILACACFVSWKNRQLDKKKHT